MTISSQIAFLLVAATLCQLLAHRLRFPSIVLLLFMGLAAGPGLGLLKVDAIFGPSLLPFVSLAVLTILFEGGLSLHPRDLGAVTRPVSLLLSVGVLANWLALGLAAHLILGAPPQLAIMVSSILVVTGPTVMGPLLRIVRPRAPVGAILYWEGILIDAIGVLLAVSMAEVITSQGGGHAVPTVAYGLFVSLIGGGILGWALAKGLSYVFDRHLIPDFLAVPMVLSSVLCASQSANAIHHEAGLVTATVCGLFLARGSGHWIRAVHEFLAQLQPLLLGLLFIVLAARIERAYFMQIEAEICLFVAAAILVARPLAVFVSTIGCGLNWRERLLIASIAPRGIVAASLASSIGLTLEGMGVPGAERVVVYVFAVIIGTVIFYGLFSPLICRLLGLQERERQGVLFVGAHSFARELAACLKRLGLRILLVDSNAGNVRAAKLRGLLAYSGNILSEETIDSISLEGIGRLFAMTSNAESNNLAAIEFRPVFGGAETYQLSSGKSQQTDRLKAAGRELFPGLDYLELEERIARGWQVTAVDIQNAAELELLQSSPSDTLALALLDRKKNKLWAATGDTPIPKIAPAAVIIFTSKSSGLGP